MRLIWCHERRRSGAARDKLRGCAAALVLGDDDDEDEDEEREGSFRVSDCRDEESLGAAAWGEEEVGVERDSSPPLESVGDSE
jgi:hypothetical protein